MKEAVSNALLFDEFTSRIINSASKSNLVEVLITILFAILVSEALTLLLYHLISVHAEHYFYSSFQSYTSLMLDLIDENEEPYIPIYATSNRSGSSLSSREKKLRIDQILITRQCMCTVGLDQKGFPNLQSVNNINAFCRPKDLTKGDFNKTIESVEDNCVICLNEFKPNDRISRSRVCYHEFHTDCYHLWLEEHDTCPYCRKNVFLPSNYT